MKKSYVDLFIDWTPSRPPHYREKPDRPTDILLLHLS